MSEREVTVGVHNVVVMENMTTRDERTIELLEILLRSRIGHCEQRPTDGGETENEKSNYIKIEKTPLLTCRYRILQFGESAGYVSLQRKHSLASLRLIEVDVRSAQS